MGMTVGAYDRIFEWAQRSAVWPVQLGLGGCAVETLAVLDPRHEMARFGPEVFRTGPRQADFLIVSGPVPRKLAPVLRRLWEQMPEPRWVLSLGDGEDGGPFRTYAATERVGRIIPVDVHVAGNPPGPEALLQGLIELKNKIDRATPGARG